MSLFDVFTELMTNLPFMGPRGCGLSIVVLSIAIMLLTIYFGYIPPWLGWSVIAGLALLSALYIPRLPAGGESD